MRKKKPFHDPAPDIHDFPGVPESTFDLVNQYGIQQAPTLIVRHGDQVEKLVNASVIKKFAADIR